MPTLTIVTTAAQAQRVADAFGKSLDLKDANDQPRAATNAEVREYLVKAIKDVVRSVEQREAEAAAVAAVSVSDLGLE